MGIGPCAFLEERGKRMIRDPATRALNQMWAEEREDGEEEKESFLPHVVPSIGDSMAVRLLRAKGRAWSKEVEDKGRHLLTLERDGAEAAWGFSLVGGREVLENGGFSSGVATRRREEGLWLSVGSVREESSAGNSGLRSKDLVTRINGRIVFHLDPADVARLIRQSGTSLYLDVERIPSKDLLYNNGLHQFSYNFLYPEPGSETNSLSKSELGRKLRSLPAPLKFSDVLRQKPGRELLTGNSRLPFKELSTFAGGRENALGQRPANEIGRNLSSIWSRGE